MEASVGQIMQLGGSLILFRVEALQGMFEKVNKVLGAGSGLVWYIAGRGAGRSMAKVFQTRFREGENPATVFDKIACLYASWGWGRMEIVGSGKNADRFVIRIYDNAFVTEQHSQKPSCHFVRGFIEGLVETLTGKHAISEETKCMAKGDHHCEFQITLK